MRHACPSHILRERIMLSNGSARFGRRHYFLRMNLFYCANVFGEDPVVDGLLRQLRQSAREYRFAIHGYCFVSKQISLLLERLAHTSSLRCFIRDWKQRTTLDYRKTTDMELWQRGHVNQMLPPRRVHARGGAIRRLNRCSRRARYHRGRASIFRI
jgi:hypothetical protein